MQTDSHSYSGSMSLASALPASDNTVFAQLGADVGPEKVRQAAYDMGITSHLDAYYAESIGGLRYGVSPLEMANAYATVADGGWRNTVTAIEKVVHPDGTRRRARQTETQEDVHRRRDVGRDPADGGRARPAAPRPDRASAARTPARPAPPPTTPTRGSSASRRDSRRRCGSASRTRRRRSAAPSSAARSPRRSGTTS